MYWRSESCTYYDHDYVVWGNKTQSDYENYIGCYICMDTSIIKSAKVVVLALLVNYKVNYAMVEYAGAPKWSIKSKSIDQGESWLHCALAPQYQRFQYR